jgi:hypothetical protein
LLTRFYKEECKGEVNTYMHLRARSAGKDPLDVLHGLVEETVASFNSVCELFANDEKALRYFQTYCYGYMLVFLPVSVLHDAD